MTFFEWFVLVLFIVLALVKALAIWYDRCYPAWVRYREAEKQAKLQEARVIEWARLAYQDHEWDMLNKALDKGK